MKTYTAPDGTTWAVSIKSPGASNAMIMFRHPDGGSSRRDRYNWVLHRGPGAMRVTSRLEPDEVLKALDDREIARLFARSMPVSRRDPIESSPEPVRA